LTVALEPVVACVGSVLKPAVRTVTVPSMSGRCARAGRLHGTGDRRRKLAHLSGRHGSTAHLIEPSGTVREHSPSAAFRPLRDLGNA
jgi:hypothetical protein